MFARGKYGIEYNPAPRREEPGPFVPIVFALVFLAAIVSLAWTVYGRLKGDRIEEAQAAAAQLEDLREEKANEAAQARAAEKSVDISGVSVVAPHVVTNAVSGAPVLRERPASVRNLLKRLEEAEKKRDVEMAVTTIEQLRALPGAPAADLDDAFAKRLGALNVQRLYRMRSPLWVIDVTVGRGDSAILLAAEHGSTYASLRNLNPGVDFNRLRIGQKLKVMNHPAFRLQVSRKTRRADLLLNGRFFKRYSLAGPVTGEKGAYEVPAQSRTFWGSVGLRLSPADRQELCELVPKGAAVVLSDD